MNSLLNAVGLPYERLDACDGTQLSPEERFAWTGGRPWLDGQIGAFISHFRAWQIIADSPARFGLILEDDLHLSKDISKVCSDLYWIPENADIVRLETTMQGMKIRSGTKIANSKRKLHLLRSEAWGTSAYLLHRETARWLVASPSRHYRPVDYFLFNKKLSPIASVLNTFQVSPALAIQDAFLPNSSEKVNIKSTIYEPDVSKTPSLIREVARKVGRRVIGRQLVLFR